MKALLAACYAELASIVGAPLKRHATAARVVLCLATSCPGGLCAEVVGGGQDALLAQAESRIRNTPDVASSLIVQALPDALQFVVPLHDSAVATVERRTGAALVRFGAAFDADALVGISERYPGWIDELSYGYDSLYIKPVAGVDIEISTPTEALIVKLVRQLAAPSENGVTASEDDGAALRLRRLSAKLRGLQGDSLGARAELRQLMEADRNDVQSIFDLVEQERRLRRWRQALALYSRALESDPDGVFVINAKAALLAERGPRLKTSFEHSDVKGSDQQFIWTLQARAFVGRAGVVGVRSERRDVEDPTVRQPDGGLKQFEGARLRSSVYFEHDALGLGVGLVEVHAAGSDAGATAAYQFDSNVGHTQVQVDLWRPYWDFVEGIVHGAYRHRAQLRQRFDIARPWALEVAAHGSRYGLFDDSRLADSFGAQLSASYSFVEGDPRLGVEYYFDTERYRGVRRGISATGEIFAPVDFSDREIHQLQVVLGEKLTDYIEVRMSAGYTYDRLNSHGHNLSVELAYRPLPDFEFGTRFSQTIAAARGGADKVSSFGGYFLIRL